MRGNLITKNGRFQKSTRHKCPLPFCDRIAKTTTYCQAHERQAFLGKSLTKLRVYQKNSGRCAASTCKNEAWCKGKCKTHYMYMRLGMIDWDRPLRKRRTGWIILPKAKRTQSGSSAFMVKRSTLALIMKMAEERGMDFHEVANDAIECFFRFRLSEKWVQTGDRDFAQERRGDSAGLLGAI